LPIFSKEKIAIFWFSKKVRFLEKLGKKAEKHGKNGKNCHSRPSRGIKSPVDRLFN
jgi:hypothetical protein